MKIFDKSAWLLFVTGWIVFPIFPLFGQSQLVPLVLYWNDTTQDNFTTRKDIVTYNTELTGYREVRIEGCVLPNQRSGTVALKLYRHSERGDTLTTVKPPGGGYNFVREEGYIFSKQQPGTVPLKTYWSFKRADFHTVATEEGINDGIAAGYTLV